jgi:hypothetical protein
MEKDRRFNGFSRRELLSFSAAGTLALAAQSTFPSSLFSPAGEKHKGDSSSEDTSSTRNLYSELVKTWCDGLLRYQVKEMHDPALDGGFLCPACGLIHGRCADAVYPLLHMAHKTGESRYLEGAQLIYDWTERQVSRPDGSWVNDVSVQDWQGITVFRSIAIAETLRHYGSLLDARTSQRWTDRLARAVKFLDGFITINAGNINYPVSASYAFALCGQVLGDSYYLDRGRNLVHTCLEYSTRPNYLIYGEGHPMRNISPKGFPSVDLGYNVEESLPGFALYATLTGDQQVLGQTIKALRSHMEFMLPDGGWDNSWGCRNYKWSWWGSRTSDGCQPAYILMAKHDPRFREVAQRNVEQMAACTHNGHLYGGPDYFVHGDFPCLHHAFTHAKALTTVLDHEQNPEPENRVSLPCDEPYGLKSFPEVGVHLASIGPWRATVTENDWKEPGEDGDHVTGGSLSMLFHRGLGPILTASMTEYELVEPPNQQQVRDGSQAPLTPRVECLLKDVTYTSFRDFSAVLKVTALHNEVLFDARGSLLSPSSDGAGRDPVPGGGTQFHMTYRVTESGVEITASATGATGEKLQFVLPVICRSDETVEHNGKDSIRITKPKGILNVDTSTSVGIESLPAKRIFNLVPGFECLPVTISMNAGEEIRIRLKASLL